jgi:hypothetical protein
VDIPLHGGDDKGALTTAIAITFSMKGSR